MSTDAGGGSAQTPFATVDILEPLSPRTALSGTWILARDGDLPAAFISPVSAGELFRAARDPRRQPAVAELLLARRATFVWDLGRAEAFFAEELAVMRPGRLIIVDRRFARTHAPGLLLVDWHSGCPYGEIIRIPPGACAECDCPRAQAT